MKQSLTKTFGSFENMDLKQKRKSAVSSFFVLWSWLLEIRKFLFLSLSDFPSILADRLRHAPDKWDVLAPQLATAGRVDRSCHGSPCPAKGCLANSPASASPP